jgi:hypothetical protein
MYASTPVTIHTRFSFSRQKKLRSRPLLRAGQSPVNRTSKGPAHRAVNSTGAGGANNTGVIRELHAYFGPFARANIQVFHLVYDDDQHLPSSIHPVKVAIVTVTVFVALSDSEKFYSQIGFLKGLPPGLRAAALAPKTAPFLMGYFIFLTSESCELRSSYLLCGSLNLPGGLF